MAARLTEQQLIEQQLIEQRLTERRAALAARQLSYHRERIEWMERRMEENAAALEVYLMESGQDTATLPGGYRLECGAEGEVSVRKPEPGTGGFEQLRLLEG